MKHNVGADEFIVSLKNKILTINNEIARIEYFKSKYKDLTTFMGTSDTSAILCSQMVNEIADSVAFTEDANGMVFAWPYVEDMSQRIYSQPPYYAIGTPNKNGFGLVPNPDLEQDMDAKNLAYKAVKEVRNYLLSKAQVDYM